MIDILRKKNWLNHFCRQPVTQHNVQGTLTVRKTCVIRALSNVH